MKLRNRNRKFAPLYSMSEEGEGGGGGAASDSGSDIQAQIDAAVEAAVTGLKAKNNELINDLKSTKENLKSWDGLDPQSVRGMMERFEKDEELKLLAEGKTEEAWNKRLEKVSATHQAQLDTLANERDNLNSELELSREQVRDLIIDQQVLSNFHQEKGLESAGPDVVARAKAAFKIEDGVPIARDQNGEIIRGADGPITIAEWTKELKTSAPHLFPSSQGAGATGAGPGGTGGDLASQMERAAANNDMAEYRRLRKERDKQQTAN